jgi:hypothetical protein
VLSVNQKEADSSTHLKPLDLCRVDNKHISAYKYGVRRKPGSLVPLETAICICAATLLRRRGIAEFHGYDIAKRLGEESNTRLLTAYGTLYRALGRLEVMALLESRWEDPEIPARENRPGRRLYRLTRPGVAVRRRGGTFSAEGGHRTVRRPVPATSPSCAAIQACGGPGSVTPAASGAHKMLRGDRVGSVEAQHRTAGGHEFADAAHICCAS